MAGTLGTIRGQVILDVRSAIASYVALRAANAATIYAMRDGAVAFAAVSKAAGAGALLFGAGLVYAVKKAADFERQLDFFGAVSDSTQAEMEAIRKKALQLGQDTVYSAGQIADSFVELGKAGVSAKLIVDGVGDAVAHLGAAADIPLDDAARIITSAVQSFSLAGRDAVHVADLLAGAANASIVDVQDLGVSLKYVGGVAHALSIPIEDVINSLALLGKYGIRGSTAGTSLRQILVSLTGTSKKAEGVLEDLGIITKENGNAFFDAEGKAKPLAEIFQILQDKTKGLTQAQKLAAFKTIFNNRALAAALDLTQAGTKGFATMNAELSKTTAAEVSAKRLDNLSGDLEILRGNIETLAIKAGGPFQEFLRGIVQGVTRLVAAFANLSPSTQKLILQIIAGAAAFFGFIAIISGAVSLVFAFAANMIRLFGAFKLIVSIMKIVIFNMRLLAAVFLMNPIGLIITAVIALIAIFVILYKKNEAFRNGVKAVGRAIVSAFQAVVDWFKGLPAFFSNLWKSITSGVTSAWNAVVNFLTVTVPGWFKTGFDKVVSFATSFVTAFVGFWTALPGRIGALVSSLVTSIVSFFAQLPGRLGYIIGFTIGFIIRLWLQFNNMLLNLAIRLVQGIINFFVALPGRIIGFFTALYEGAVSIFTSFWKKSISIAQSVVSGVIGFIAALPGRIASFFSSMRNKAVSLFNAFLSSARSIAKSIYSGVVSAITSLPGKIASLFTSMKNKAVSLLKSLVSSAKSLGKDVYNGIRDGINALPGLVSGIFGRVLSAFREMAGRAFSAAKDFAGGLWNGFKDGLGINSPSFIEKALWQINDVADEETKRLRSGVKVIQGLGRSLNTFSLEPTAPMMANKTAIAATKAANELARLQKVQNSLAKASGDIRSSIDTRMPVTSLTVSKPAPEVRSKRDDRSGDAPLIGEMKVYNPVTEPASQTATRQATRAALLGGPR